MSKPSKARKGRFGYINYAEILADLKAGPKSAVDLRLRHNVCRNAINEIMRRMEWLKLAHVCETRIQDKHRVNVWSIGEGPSIAEQMGCSMVLPRKPASLITFASIIRALSAANHSAETLSEEVGTSRDRTSKLLRGMRALGLIYVAEYVRAINPGGVMTTYYRFGDKRDAERPRPVDKKTAQKKRNRVVVDRRRQVRFMMLQAANIGTFTEAA